MVTVTTASDLRTLSLDSFNAESVVLPSPIQTLSGTIVSVGDNSLTVKGAVSAAIGMSNVEQQTYTILVSKDTSVSLSTISPATTTSPQPQTPHAVSLKDLAQDMNVTVTFDSTKQTDNTITAISVLSYATPSVPAAPLSPSKK